MSIKLYSLTLLSHPCEIDGDKVSRIKETVEEAFKLVGQNWDTSQKVRLAILPIFTGARWMCVRVEFDWGKHQLSILFDDPQGATLINDSRLPQKKQNSCPYLTLVYCKK